MQALAPLPVGFPLMSGRLGVHNDAKVQLAPNWNINDIQIVDGTEWSLLAALDPIYISMALDWFNRGMCGG